MHTADYSYDLPEELIAQTPAEPRDSARLLVLDRSGGALQHRHVSDLPRLLRADDLLVVNRSRVLPSRVLGQLASGGQAEMLLLRRLGRGHWQVLTRPARRLRIGKVIALGDALQARVVREEADGVREVEVSGSADDVDADLLAHGSVPLPPYIRGWVGDPERYQTIFGDIDGSAAAPTAGLHFTPRLMEMLEQAGVGVARVILHVGLDTFRPMSVDDPRQHPMHREWYEVPEEVREAVRQTRARGGRIVAVGTTSVRALEAWGGSGEAEGWTDLFIMPGYQYRVVDALLTNFHLPRSTLLLLVSAFAGRERLLEAYAEAVRKRYRFFSFGDAMLLV